MGSRISALRLSSPPPPPPPPPPPTPLWARWQRGYGLRATLANCPWRIDWRSSTSCCLWSYGW